MMMRHVLMMMCMMITTSFADIYLHNPAGSNNRNRERNENRNNANRLFDSQNNDKGGYPWRGDREMKNSADPMIYYEGSKLRVEWTNQHACGDDPTTFCTMVLQYACEDTLTGVRDGYPSGDLSDADENNANYSPKYMKASFQRNNGDGTTTIPTDSQSASDTEYGMHESFHYYSKCSNVERNHGLYIADRNLGCDSRFTRQQPNGQRYGYECNEERDYFPYWNPSPWRDIAVLTTDPSWCSYYRENSENVKDRFECVNVDVERTPHKKIPINELNCTSAGGTWQVSKSFGDHAPECRSHQHSRQNHLGNVATSQDGFLKNLPETAHFDWTIPKIPGGIKDSSTCVFRIRYNISTNDYGNDETWGSYMGFDVKEDEGLFDARYNCEKGMNKDAVDYNSADAGDEISCVGAHADGNFRPRFNRPYVDVFGKGADSALAIALNSDQSGRTFQDRSHVFKISKRPNGLPSHATIWNLNFRGRRGNIVQAYPAVEYDFVPQDLSVNRGEYVHFQWVGSDFNAARNPNNAEGWQYSDRHNMVEVKNMNQQFPLAKQNMKFFKNENQAFEFASQNAASNLKSRGASCKTFKNGNANEQNDPLNCGKLNFAPAHFNVAPMEITQSTGTYFFTDTRDNNFSNRAQKFVLTIHDTPAWKKAMNAIGITIGVFAGLGIFAITAFFGYCWYHNRMDEFYEKTDQASKCLSRCCCCCCSHEKKSRGWSKKKKKKKGMSKPLIGQVDIEVEQA